MLLPKKLKHRKHQRGQMPGFDRRGSTLAYGAWGLKSLERGWVNSREIEAARRAITRFMKRGGQVWIRIFPDKPVTKASPETPMGSGKGALDHFVAVVRPGRILFEIGGVDELTAREAMRLGMHKLSVKTRLIRKGDQ